MTGIYKITSPTGKVYIGQTIDYKKRLCYYRYYKGRGQPRLYYSIIKYGVDNHSFEFIHKCLCSELNKMERYYQDQYDSTGIYGLNCKLTGHEDIRSIISKETTMRMTENSGKAKIVLNLQTGIFYNSCREAADSTSNYSKGLLSKKLSGWNKNTTDFIYV